MGKRQWFLSSCRIMLAAAPAISRCCRSSASVASSSSFDLPDLKQTTHWRCCGNNAAAAAAARRQLPLSSSSGGYAGKRQHKFSLKREKLSTLQWLILLHEMPMMKAGMILKARDLDFRVVLALSPHPTRVAVAAKVRLTCTTLSLTSEIRPM